MGLFDNFNDGLKSKRQKLREENEELERLKDETEFEKGDLLALIIAAIVTLVPVVLGIMLIYYTISMLIFN